MTRGRKPLHENTKDYSKENPDTGCWEWQYAINQWGYGTIQGWLAHRKMYSESCGDIPEGMMVLHHCDTPACINPEHLFLGTNADNMQDMKEKGRGRTTTGENKWSAKITEPDVVRIREMRWNEGMTNRAIAQVYPLSASQVSAIAHRKKWKHVIGGPFAPKQAYGYCKNGHALSGDNLLKRSSKRGQSQPSERCRTCQDTYQRRYSERKRLGIVGGK